MWIISFRDDQTYDDLQNPEYIWAVGRTKKECEQNWVDKTRAHNLPKKYSGYYSQFKTIYDYNRHEEIFHNGRNKFFIYEV